MSSAIVRVGVGVIVTNKLFPKCVLVGVRKGIHGSGKLSAPGGHLELFETWESCAIREVKEETNLDIENVRFINVTNDPMIGKDSSKHFVTIFMSGCVKENSDSLMNMEPNKCESWKWIPFEELCEIRTKSPEILFPPMIHFLKTLQNNQPTNKLNV